MADDQIIGTVAVQIEADASDLQGQFDAAVAQATAAGGQIAQGISAGASGFDQIGQSVLELDSLFANLKAIGIAGAIEKIGSSSLEAYASLQKATIALTSLTGSAAQAQSEIANLRTIAQDDALSFPSLVNANQRFTALGVAAGQIPSALTAAANAAAAMNSSFDQTSNAMERIVSSGTLSARVLVQLGINLQDVASAMGVSSADVVKDFKAITDEGQRLDILTDAMSKLQGTAEAVADSLSGSFQRVQNTMLTTFQQIGESIAPAAKDLADLAQVIIPEVGQAVQGLAAPAVSIVEFGKALTEAKDSIGSFVDSASGIPGLFKEIETAASNSGASFSSLVPGMDLVTEAFHSLTNGIEAYTNQGSNIVTMGNLIVDNLARQTTAIKVGGQAFQDAMKNSTAFIGAEGEIDTATTKIVTSAQAAQKAYQDMSTALANNTKDAAGNVVSANDVANAYDNWQKKLAALNDLNPHFADTVGGVTKSINDQQQVINTLTQTILQLMAAQDGSAAKAEALAKAQAQLSSALQSVVDAAKGQSTAIVGTGEGYTYMGDQAEALVQKQRDLTLSVQQAAAEVKVLNDQADSSPEHTRAVIQALTDWETAIKNTGGDLNQLQTIVINGVLFSGKLPDIIKQAQDQLKQFGGTVVSVADEFNVLGVYAGVISDTMKSNITVIKGSDDAMKSYNGTIISGHQAVTQISGDVTKASNYFQQFTGSVDSTGAAIGNTLTPNLNSASSKLSTLSLEAEQAKRALDGLAESADDSFKATTQAVDGLSTAIAFLSVLNSGETAFSGSGAARNAQGQQVSQLTQTQMLEFQQGQATAQANLAAEQAALAQTYPQLSNATVAQTTATTALTTSTTAATSSTAALNTTINNLSTSANNSSSVVSSTTDSVTGLTTVIGNAAPVVDFAAMSSSQLGTSINTLNSQLLNAGVVVNGAGLSAVDYATKLQDTVDGMNASSAAVQSLSKSSVSAATSIATAATVIAEAGQAVLQSATGSGPSSPSAALTSSLTALSAGATPTQTTGTNAIPVVLGTYFGPNGLNTITGTPGESLAQALAAMFPGGGSGSFSMQSAIAQTPAIPFGANASPSGSQTPVTIQMNYPQFNSQQQSNKVMSDMIANLRTVAGQKL